MREVGQLQEKPQPERLSRLQPNRTGTSQPDRRFPGEMYMHLPASSREARSLLRIPFSHPEFEILSSGLVFGVQIYMAGPDLLVLGQFRLWATSGPPGSPVVLFSKGAMCFHLWRPEYACILLPRYLTPSSPG